MTVSAVCSELGCCEPAVADGLCEECREDLICVSEDCNERNDDGEGYDGYCGNCADRLEAQGHWD